MTTAETAIFSFDMFFLRIDLLCFARPRLVRHFWRETAAGCTERGYLEFRCVLWCVGVQPVSHCVTHTGWRNVSRSRSVPYST
jgi:hypothetical protein